MVNEVHRAELAITNLISYKGEWNNCFIKFSRLVYLDLWPKRPEVDEAKTTASGKSHGMRAV